VPEDPAITELSLLGKAFNTMTNSLRKAEQVKDAFIVDVTHELRTPLTVIKGTIETLQDGALDDLAAREPFLDSMGQETERLIRLVNDLLVLTRADGDALNLQIRPVDLRELARSRCEHMQPYASQCQVRLIVDASPVQGEPHGDQNAAPILADADRLAQVLDNLLDNAIRYSSPGSEVRIVIDDELDQVKCQVVDTGPGIPAKHLPYIFERFYRVDPARERNRGGSGLGLSIVRGLIMAHGGRVSASSVEGQGTTVSFWLPTVGY
jgi:signal transduction histidine kinase